MPERSERNGYKDEKRGGDMKIAFLDRDGTISRDYPDEVWRQIRYPEILPGSLQGMKHIEEKGYEIIIVTNQYIIGEGHISIEQYNDFNKKVLEQLKENGIAIKDVFYCPHARVTQCDCCKPKTGMIKQALKKYPNINLAESFMCGDSEGDMLCAESMGLKFFGINIGLRRIKDLSDLCGLI